MRSRFQSLAGARSFSGLVPSLSASGVNARHGPPAKSGDAPLREALFMGADREIASCLSIFFHSHTCVDRVLQASEMGDEELSLCRRPGHA